MHAYNIYRISTGKLWPQTGQIFDEFNIISCKQVKYNRYFIQIFISRATPWTRPIVQPFLLSKVTYELTYIILSKINENRCKQTLASLPSFWACRWSQFTVILNLQQHVAVNSHALPFL